MQQWEYEFWVGPPPGMTREWMKDRGEEGWELVTVIRHESYTGPHPDDPSLPHEVGPMMEYIFKRPTTG